MDLTIYTGLGVTFIVITIIKMVRYRFRTTELPLSFFFWGLNNWFDYVIHLAVTWVFFFFESDVIKVVNPLLQKLINWQIQSPDNKSFGFIIIPVIVSVVGYTLARKFISKPIQKTLAPKTHLKFNK